MLRIKQLVFGEGLTLAGARRRLEEEHGDPPMVVGGRRRRARRYGAHAAAAGAIGLEAILAMLSRDASGPELQLVLAVGRRHDRARSGTVKRAMAEHTAKPATKSGAAKKRRAS